MKRFGSMRRLREASLDDIAAVEGVPADVARAVFDAVHA
jgi:excinuclease ABC subunit C